MRVEALQLAIARCGPDVSAVSDEKLFELAEKIEVWLQRRPRTDSITAAGQAGQRAFVPGALPR